MSRCVFTHGVYGIMPSERQTRRLAKFKAEIDEDEMLDWNDPDSWPTDLQDRWCDLQYKIAAKVLGTNLAVILDEIHTCHYTGNSDERLERSRSPEDRWVIGVGQLAFPLETKSLQDAVGYLTGMGARWHTWVTASG